MLFEPLLDVKLNFFTAVKGACRNKIKFLLGSYLLLMFFAALLCDHEFTLAHRTEKYSPGGVFCPNFIFPAVLDYSIAQEDNHDP